MIQRTTTILFFLIIAFPVFGVDLYYTSCTNGQMENCHCPSQPLGAMEKRTAEIERRRSVGEDFFLVDSGDFMPAMQDSFAARTMIEIMDLNGYDAIGLGDQEILQGRTIVEEILESLPVVTTNLAYRESGELLAEPFRILEKGGSTLFIAAIIDPDALQFMSYDLVNYVTILPVDSCLTSILASAPADAEVIVLSHSGAIKDVEYASSWENVDLIVGGHSQTRIPGVDRDYEIPYVQAGCNARYLGIARIRGDRVRAELFEIRPELPDDERVLSLLIELRRDRGVLRGRNW